MKDFDYILDETMSQSKELNDSKFLLNSYGVVP